MLKIELEQNYNKLKEEYKGYRFRVERKIKELNGKVHDLKQELEETRDRERTVLLNLVAMQFAKKSKHHDPNTKMKYEEIVTPDLERGYHRPVNEKTRRFGSLL